MLPVHGHNALHPFAQLLHLYNLLLLHVLQELRELRERAPAVGGLIDSAHALSAYDVPDADPGRAWGGTWDSPCPRPEGWGLTGEALRNSDWV